MRYDHFSGRSVLKGINRETYDRDALPKNCKDPDFTVLVSLLVDNER